MSIGHNEAVWERASLFAMLTATREKEFSRRSFLAKNWWVVLFFLFCTLFYAQGMKKKRESLKDLQERYQEVQVEKMKALELQEELRTQVASQKDPAWVEMTLMRTLGLVPDGQRKVYFKKQD